MCHLTLTFATFAFLFHLAGWLLFSVSCHLLTVILILPGGTEGSTVIIYRAQKFKIILMIECWRPVEAFTKQVHFYACKIQIKLRPYPSNRNTAHLGTHTPRSHSRYSLDSLLACQLNLFLRQLQIKLLNFQSEVLENCRVSFLVCQ